MAKMKKALELSVLSRQIVLFKQLGWSIDSDTNLFERFCELLSYLTPEEQDLVLDMTQDFVRITFPDYVPLYQQVLSTVDPKIVDTVEEVFLLPLVAPDDMGKSKSGHAVLYRIEHKVFPIVELLQPVFKRRAIKCYTNLDTFLERHLERKTSLVFLVDDFIGTGETAIKAYEHFVKNYSVGFDKDKIILMTLVIMERGLLQLRGRGVEILFDRVCRRGISDSARLIDKDKALKLIDDIEGRLGISSKFSRGYMGSEALVTMDRTPNNTFPVYWTNQNYRTKTPWPAPFPR